jgi:UTP:GlnB (protein PII) uridylyltransferase
MVQVTAPDTTGLLCAVANAISAGGANIEAARLASEDGMANDVFICEGTVDGVALADALSEVEVVEGASTLGQVLTAPLAAGVQSLQRSADLLARLRR